MHFRLVLTCVGLTFAPVIVTIIVSLTLCFPTVSAQIQSCHDATGCGGNEISGVSNATDCCLGSGLSFRNSSGACQQCTGKQLQVRVVC